MFGTNRTLKGHRVSRNIMVFVRSVYLRLTPRIESRSCMKLGVVISCFAFTDVPWHLLTRLAFVKFENRCVLYIPNVVSLYKYQTM